MLSESSGRQNAYFNALIALAIGLLLGLIVLAVGVVMVRGFSSLLVSLRSREIQFAIRLSFFTSVVSTLMCVLLGIPVAYGMARARFRGKEILNTILDIPLALPPIVSGAALLLLFGNTALGHFLSGLGLEFVFTVQGIILAQFFVNIPYMLRVLKSTIEDIDPRMEFVARTLGCSKVGAFFRVTLPLAKNGLVAGIVITWARALGEFGAALMLAGATRLKTETLPVSLFLNMSCGDLNLALSAATCLILISLVSLFIFEYLGGDVNLSRASD